MKKKHRKKSISVQNRNAGMSLLEVIIAVSIFSIAAMVLLQGFVTSARINRKSNLYLEATSTAQNVMEEIKARPFEEVSLAFNYPINLRTGESRFTFLNSQRDNLNNGQLLLKEVKKAADGGYIDVRKYQSVDGDDMSKVSASVISKDEGKTFEFNPSKEGKYYFQMQNVENLHEKFDVLVEFDGGMESGYRKKTPANAEEGKNDYEAPNIARLDTKNNAFHIMKKDWANEAAWAGALDKQFQRANELWTSDYKKWFVSVNKVEELPDGTKVEHPTASEIDEYIKNNPKPQRLNYADINKFSRRKLILTLENEREGILKIHAKYLICAYDYVKKNGTKYERMDICPCHGSRKQEIKEKDTFKEISDCFCSIESVEQEIYVAEADSKLKNVYLFYYPNYNSQETDPLDMIEFRNEAGEPVILNITKQRDPDRAPESSMEQRYGVYVTIEEVIDNKNINWNTNPGLYKAKTKFKSNLDYDISKTDEIDKRERLNQMNLVFVGKNGSSVKKVSQQAAKNILSFNGLDDRNAFDRIYLANVKVYKAGEAAKGFQGKPLVVLDGAKEN